MYRWPMLCDQIAYTIRELNDELEELNDELEDVYENEIYTLVIDGETYEVSLVNRVLVADARPGSAMGRGVLEAPMLLAPVL